MVTLVLWLPDLYLLDLGQPGRAVAVLMVMHLAIALVTYNCLMHIARVRAAALELRQVIAYSSFPAERTYLRFRRAVVSDRGQRQRRKQQS